jgi:hypothetical protein
MSNWVLSVNGVTINRDTTKVYLDGFDREFETPGSLSFHEYAAKLPGTYQNNESVALSYLGTPVFQGLIVDRSPDADDKGLKIRYQALGLRHWGDQVPVTNPNDGTGTIVFNLPGDNLDYNASLAGMSVGSILSYLFTNHATALAAVGIAGFIGGDLTPLALVPPAPVTVNGSHFFSQVDQILGDWSAYYICTIEWQSGTSDWRIRVKDTTAYTANTLTLGVDPIDLTPIRRDTAECYTRVAIRGRSIVEGAYLSQALGTLTPAWSSPDQTSWNWNAFAAPGGAVDSGTITALTATQATCQSSSGTETWSTNQWSTNKAWFAAINPAATDITQTEFRNVTSNAAMSAGGTAVVTVDHAFVNAGYTHYRLVGAMPGTVYNVWRRYNITSTYIKAHLLRKFAFPVPYANAFMVQNVSYPVFFVQGATDGFPWAAQLDTVNGQVVFNEPTVKGINTQTNLNTGGASVTAPADVQAFVPYSRGVLETFAPSNTGGSVIGSSFVAGSGYTSAPTATIFGDGTNAAVTVTVTSGAISGVTIVNPGLGYSTITVVLSGGGGTGGSVTLTLSASAAAYSGTGYTVDGIQRTWTLDLPQWLLTTDTANINAYANMLLTTVSNAVLTGEVTYHGVYATALTPGNALNINGNNGAAYTTGWESGTIAAIPIRGASFQFVNGLSETVITKMRLSNRRKPFTGERFFVHPTFSGSAAWEAGGGQIGYEQYGAAIGGGLEHGGESFQEAAGFEGFGIAETGGDKAAGFDDGFQKGVAGKGGLDAAIDGAADRNAGVQPVQPSPLELDADPGRLAGLREGAIEDLGRRPDAMSPPSQWNPIKIDGNDNQIAGN